MKLRYFTNLGAAVRWTAVLSLSLFSMEVSATVSLPEIFKSGAILQQNKNVNVWGTASPGEQVTATYTRSGVTRTGTATTDANGRWLLQLDLTAVTASATTGTLVIAGSNTITLSDVYVGEVWIAAGQSNMQADYGSENQPSEANAPAANPLIRTFRSSTGTSVAPSTDLPGNPTWGSGTANMSVVALNFATQLHEELNGIPVGFIQAAFSGTPIRSFISEASLQSNPVGQEVLSLYAGTSGNQAPARVFNAMVNPLIPYTIRGVIWYQGENDVNDPVRYRTLFPLLISSWRTHFQDPNMPFYFVQLPGYNTSADRWPDLRKVQADIDATVPATGMAVIHDIGNPTLIHPPDKDIVGQRLANLALSSTYGVAGIAGGPLFDHAEFGVNGTNGVRLHFQNAAAGMQVLATEKVNFQIAGPDGVFLDQYSSTYAVSLDAATNTITVTSSKTATPKSIRFAWMNYIRKSSLRNGAGLPCPPFLAQATVFEAETLNHTAISSGDIVGVIEDPVFSNGILRTFGANAPNDFITFPIPVTVPGTYYIKLRYKRFTTRGQCLLEIDEVPQGSLLDQYGTNAMLEANFGAKTFTTAGVKSFTFRVPSKNAASEGYGITFDYIKLQPQ